MKAKVNGVWVDAYLPSRLSGSDCNGESSVYEGKTLAVLGDSISSFIGMIPNGQAHYYYPERTGNLPVSSYAGMYWEKVCSALRMARGVINGWASSRVTATHASYADPEICAQAGCLDRAKALGVSPDVIIVYLGTNDFRNGVPIGTYSSESASGVNTIPQLVEIDGVVDASANAGVIELINSDFRLAYAVMLDRIRQKYPYAEIWCCTLPAFEHRNTVGGTGYPEINDEGITIYQYNNAIRDIASFCGCKVIDLASSALSSYNTATMMQDYGEAYPGSGLHPNIHGHSAIANEIIRTLDPSCRMRYNIRQEV